MDTRQCVLEGGRLEDFLCFYLLSYVSASGTEKLDTED